MQNASTIVYYWNMDKRNYNNKNGFHHIKLIIAELAFSSFFITLFTSSSLLGYWAMIVFGATIIWFSVSLSIKAIRQIPTFLGYTELASERTKATSAKTKAAIDKTKAQKKSLQYVYY